MERIHQEISKSIFSEKLKNKDTFNLQIAVSNAVKSKNNIISSVTKYKPYYSFFNNDPSVKNEVIQNTKYSQKMLIL